MIELGDEDAREEVSLLLRALYSVDDWLATTKLWSSDEAAKWDGLVFDIEQVLHLGTGEARKESWDGDEDRPIPARHVRTGLLAVRQAILDDLRSRGIDGSPSSAYGFGTYADQPGGAGDA